MSRGTLVVVGGHSRRVGKTCMMRAVASATPEMNWQVTKISSHRHRGCDKADMPGLLRLSDEEFAAGIGNLLAKLTAGTNLLVESNRIVNHVAPDLVIFVVDPLNPDWKASSGPCLQRASALVFSQEGPTPPPLLLMPRALPSFRLAAWNQSPVGFADWLRRRLFAGEEVSSHETASCVSMGRIPNRLVGPVRCDVANQMGQCDHTGLDPLAIGSLGLV